MERLVFCKCFVLSMFVLLLHTTAYSATTLIISYGDINVEAETLTLEGNNFDAFGQPVVMVGNAILQNCLISTTEITCSISGTPVLTRGGWKVKVSAGNSPHSNTEIDLFSRSELAVQTCLS